MKKLLIASLAALWLAGCASGGGLPTINVQNAVNLNTLEGVVSAYGIMAEQERVLKMQPLCKTGTVPSLTNLCVKRSIIVTLQKATAIAKAAVDNAVLFVSGNPTVDPSQYIQAAQSAILAAQGVYNAAKGP
jgi:hypothetical protein